MKIAEIRALEKVFIAEVQRKCGIPLYQSGKRIYRDLAEKGMVVEESVVLGGGIPVTVTGWALTHLGRMEYCATCSPNDDAD
jgi:hypothetical protein